MAAILRGPGTGQTSRLQHVPAGRLYTAPRSGKMCGPRATRTPGPADRAHVGAGGGITPYDRAQYFDRVPTATPPDSRTFTFSPDPDFETKLLDIVDPGLDRI
jgi:hypothetical protein